MPAFGSTRDRHSFGGNAATRANQRAERASSGENYIKNFKDDRTVIRVLFEDPKLTWHEYYQHFDKQRRMSYPCGREVFGTCVGCRHPVGIDPDGELSWDERKKDHGWSVRSGSLRYVVPVLNEKNYIDLRSVSKTFRDEVAAIYEATTTITAQDAVVTKVKDDRQDAGAEMRQKYVLTLVGPAAERKHTKELRELYAMCAAGLAAAPLSEEQTEANMRWVNGYLALGIPNIGEILGDKYVYALEQYGSSLAEEEALAAQFAAAKEEGGKALANLKAQALAGVSTTTADIKPADGAVIGGGVPPVELQIQELCRILTDWGVPYPGDATLDALQKLYDAFLPGHPNDPHGNQPPQATQTPETEPQRLARELAEHGVALPEGADENQIRMMHGAFSPTWPTAAAPTAPAPDEAQADPLGQMVADLKANGVEIPPGADNEIIKYLWDAIQTPAATPPTAQAQAAAGYPLEDDGKTPKFAAMETVAITAWLDAQLKARPDMAERFNYDPTAPRSEILAIAVAAAIPF